MAPRPQTPAAATPSIGSDFDAMIETVTTMYGEIWWQILLVSLASAVGMLGLLALLTDHNRPTVGEALKAGLVYLLPYIAAQLLIGAIVYATLRTRGGSPGEIARAERGARELRKEIEEDEARRGSP